jgi:hypothetical protein
VRVVDPVVGEELIDGVDRHVLDPGDLVAADTRGTLRALVAIVEGEAEHAPLLVQQRVVHAPGVDADAIELAAAQRLERLREQVQQVPVQPVREAHGPIGEAVALLERHRAPVEAPADDAPG